MEPNPFENWINELTQWLKKGEAITEEIFNFQDKLLENRSQLSSTSSKRLLIFSPHPDDETITGALAIRLMRELGYDIVNIAVTLGSNPARQLARLEELKRACKYLGFKLLQLEERGLEKVNLKTRNEDPEGWNKKVEKIVSVLLEQKPDIVFFPHEFDANTTHIGVHFLVVDALKKITGFSCWTVETEYWTPIHNPNLMIEVAPELLAQMITALTFHKGEISRNPYHILLPTWMADNVRRGAELVGGQGSAAPRFFFATLYRISRWENGSFKSVFSTGKIVSMKDSLEFLFK